MATARGGRRAFAEANTATWRDGPYLNRAGAGCWGPMGAGGRLAVSDASGLPYAMGRRAFGFLKA